MGEIKDAEWNDSSLVKLHVAFYRKIGELTKEVDDMLSQQAFLCVDAIEKRDREKFNIYADYIRATIQHDRNLQKRIGRESARKLFKAFKDYSKEMNRLRKERRDERWKHIRMKLGFK